MVGTIYKLHLCHVVSVSEPPVVEMYGLIQQLFHVFQVMFDYRKMSKIIMIYQCAHIFSSS